MNRSEPQLRFIDDFAIAFFAVWPWGICLMLVMGGLIGHFVFDATRP